VLSYYVWQATDEIAVSRSALGAPASAGLADQINAVTDDDSEIRTSMDEREAGTDSDQPTGFSELPPSGTSDDMGACLECSIVVVVDEVELEPSTAEGLPSSARLFVTVSDFLPFRPHSCSVFRRSCFVVF
jgi:hypothetical protein